MKILFCDLCNESVPQGDLDLGRAFMRKGRVVCGKCDKLMTQRDELSAALSGGGASAGSGPFGGFAAGPAGPASSPANPGPSWAPGGAPGGSSGVAPGTAGMGAGQATLTPLAIGGAPAPGDAGAHHHGTGHHHAAGHGRPRGSGSGVAVGLMAIALTACGLYWLVERSDKVSADVSARLTAFETELQDADRRAMERSTESSRDLLALQARTDTLIDNQHKAVTAELEAASTKHGAALASVDDLRKGLTVLKELEPSIARHDQELNTSALRFAQLERRANELESALAGLELALEESRKAAAAAPVAPAAQPAPAGAPPWMGLVQQLESEIQGDRWLAVQSLGETRDPAVAEYILPRLKDVDIFVRMVTARVLGDLGSPKSIGALIDALGDNDAAVREAAYLALCSVSKKNLPFDPHQDAADRAKKVKAWQEWWKKAQEEGGPQ